MNQLKAEPRRAITEFFAAYKRDLNSQLALIARLECLLAAGDRPEQHTALADHRNDQCQRTSMREPVQQRPAIWRQWPTASEVRQQRTPPRANQN